MDGNGVRHNSHKLFGQERETVDEAWPGDVIGLVGHSEFGIGDTLTQDKAIVYDEIPRFPPEVFTYISNPSSSDAKKYRAGLEHAPGERRKPGQVEGDAAFQHAVFFGGLAHLLVDLDAFRVA